MENELIIFLISDNREDNLRIVNELNSSFNNVRVIQADNYQKFDEIAKNEKYDLVITDYLTEWINGIEVSQIIKDLRPNCPVLMYTDKGNEEVAATALKSGLDDYVIKTPTHNSCLRIAIRSAKEQAQQKEIIKETEIRYQNLFEGTRIGLYRINQEGKFLFSNHALAEMLGYENERSLIDKNIQELFVNNEECLQWLTLMNRHNVVRDFNTRMKKQDGSEIWVEGSSHITKYGAEEFYCYEGSLKDVTKRKLTEQKLVQTAQRLNIMHEIDQVINLSKNIDETILSTLERINDLIPCDWAGIEIFDEKQNVSKICTISYKDKKIRRATISLSEINLASEFSDRNEQNISSFQSNASNISTVGLIAKKLMKSLLSVPIISDNTLIGSLNIGSQEENGFDEEKFQIAKEVTVPLSIAIQNAKLEEAESKAINIAQTIHLATAALSQSLNPNDVLKTLLEYIGKIIKFDKSTIIMMKDNFHIVTKLESENDCMKITQDSEVCKCDFLDHPIFSIPIQTKKHLYIEDTKKYPNLKSHQIGENIKSWVCIPLFSEENILGLILFGKMVINGFTPSDIDLTEALATHASSALQNALLFQKVSEAETKLRQLAHKVVLSQEEERKMISRDLHDEAGQALTAIKIGLKLIQSELNEDFPSIKTRLNELSELTNHTITQIRNLAQNLRPPVLDTIGLNLTLEDYCERFQERTKINVSYKGDNLPQLPEAIKICIYRCVQEALNNVAKHSKAKYALVSLFYNHNSINLTIQDDGRGFEGNQNLPDTTEKIGLIGMRERVSLLNGKIEIESEKNCGVKIAVEIPFEEEL